MDKKWYESKGTIGAVLLILGGLVGGITYFVSGQQAGVPYTEAIGMVFAGISLFGIRAAIPTK